MPRADAPLPLHAWAAASGVIAAGVLLAVTEALAALVARGSSALLAVGSFVVDVVPRPLKEFAIRTFGDADKPALLIGLALAVVIAAAVAGIVAVHRLPIGAALLAVGGVLAGAAIVTRPGASALAWLPPTVGTLVAVGMLVLLIRRLRAPRVTPTDPGEEPRLSRRSFFTLAAVTTVAAVAVGVGARLATAATTSVAAVRRALTLPTPASRVTIPAGAELDVPGITPLITPNDDFYRVDTALTVPSVDPSTWRLVIDGMVDRRVELTFDELLAMGVDEYAITLTCVSNEVGGGLVGNAVWLGIPIRDVLRLAGVDASADMVLSRSVDGYTASTPLEVLTDPGRDAILAVGMNGEPLPLDHGFPVRMVVPGLYGYVSATKWLTGLTVTTFAKDEAYWTPRGYSAKAPIKFSSRVDTPKLGTAVAAGTVPIAGVAWAQTVGVDRVEVSIDDGPWQPATLSAPINDDTWVQWMLPWEAAKGSHYIVVRALDKAGNVQIQDAAPIAPDGSSGWQRTLVTVT